MKKTKKLSINTLLLIVDIPIVLFLINNKNNAVADIYLSIRFIMMSTVMIIMTFKLIYTYFISFKMSGVFQAIFALLFSDDYQGNLPAVFSNVKNIFLVTIEIMLLLSLFMFTMERFQPTMIMSNTYAMFISFISLNLVLVLIRIYSNKRCDMLINSLQKKDNLEV
ncbi:MAG: hypothetical protein RSD36_11025 [Terrisporobacter sp.]